MTDIIYPELSYIVQGAFNEVYNALRYFELTERAWENALVIELAERGVAARQQVEYALHYKGYRIGRFFVDVLVDDKMVIELKVEPALLPIDVAQVLTYLKVNGLKLGILVNFGGNQLEFKRIPNFVGQGSAPAGLPAGPDASAGRLLYPELTGVLRALLYEVHRELGPSLMHMHYRRASRIELRQRAIAFEVKKELAIPFRGRILETRHVRFLVVDNKILLAPVAVRDISPLLKGRFRQYLQLLGLKLGLIANFHARSLKIETVRL